MSIVARGLARGAAAGFIVAVGLGLGSTPINPPTPPVEISAAPSAGSGRAQKARDERMVKHQNDVILAVVMAAVNSRLLE